MKNLIRHILKEETQNIDSFIDVIGKSNLNPFFCFLQAYSNPDAFQAN